MTWIIYVLAAAAFISVAAVLAKMGTKKADTALAAGLFTTVILIGAFLLARGSISISQIASFGRNTIIFLILAGLTTGAAILCFFKALHTGEVSHVVPVVQINTILVIILFLIFISIFLITIIIRIIILFSHTRSSPPIYFNHPIYLLYPLYHFCKKK